MQVVGLESLDKTKPLHNVEGFLFYTLSDADEKTIMLIVGLNSNSNS